MVDVGFQSEHLVEKLVEGIANVLHPTYNDNKETLIQMEKATSQPTQILPQLLQQMQQMQIVLA